MSEKTASGTRLSTIGIEEVSGVDAPAHLEDGWLVMKSASSLRELLSTAEKAADPEDETMSKDAGETVEPTVEELQAEIASLRAELASKPEPAPADPGDEIAKALSGLPDEIKKAVEAQTEAIRKEAEVAKAAAEAATQEARAEREKREERDAIAKAKDSLGFVPVPPSVGNSRADLGRFLHTLEKAAGELGEPFTKSVGDEGGESVTIAEQVFDILKAANGLLESAQIYSELGSGLDDDTAEDPDAKLTKMAKARQESDPSLSFSQAYRAVTEENPDLYAQIVNG